MNTRSLTWAARLWLLAERAIGVLEALQPAAQLAARLYVASVFFRSGQTKIVDWETTLALFHDEYHVPLIDPAVAAYLGTGGELALPVLLALGFACRFAAAGLFILNAVAAMSLADIAPAALEQHVFWGSLITGLLLWGPGRWSLDRWVAPWLRRRLVGSRATEAGYTAAAPASRG